MSAEKEFWEWFVRNQEMLFNFEVDRENIFDQVSNALQKVDSDLSFEFGPLEAPRELVISASGIKRAFPAVTALVNAAPELPQWKVIAFRPRRDDIGVIEFHGKRVDPKDVQFYLLNNGKAIGIYLFIPDYLETDTDLQVIGYLLLDCALGEYDVETKLGLIKFHSQDQLAEEERYSFSELPAMFDQLVSQLENRDSKPN